MIVALVACAVIGALLPVQTQINTRLSRAVSSTFLASFVSFLVGSLALAVAVAVGRTRLPDAALLASQPWWLWTGGLCGVVYLTLNMVLMRALGASVTVVLPILGQVLGGVLIDSFGLLGVERQPMSVARAVGLLLVLLGAVLVTWARRPAVTGTAPAAAARTAPAPVTAPARPARRTGGRRLLAGLGVVSGVLSATQTTVNGRLGTVLGSATSAALVSFVVGLVALGVVVAVARPAVTGATVRATVHPWYLVVGGVLGASFVLGSAAAAPVLGISLTVSVVLLGQLAAGLSVDRWGVLGAPRRAVGPRRLVGVALVLLGVVCVRLLGS